MRGNAGPANHTAHRRPQGSETSSPTSRLNIWMIVSIESKQCSENKQVRCTPNGSQDSVCEKHYGAVSRGSRVFVRLFITGTVQETAQFCGAGPPTGSVRSGPVVMHSSGEKGVLCIQVTEDGALIYGVYLRPCEESNGIGIVDPVLGVGSSGLRVFSALVRSITPRGKLVPCANEFHFHSGRSPRKFCSTVVSG
jgi:hypothetical protein